MKLTIALTTSSVLTTARSENFCRAAERTMISSSIHADMPQNLLRNRRTGWLFLFGHFVVAVILPTCVHFSVE
jgi:hypothetical protein